MSAPTYAALEPVSRRTPHPGMVVWVPPHFPMDDGALARFDGEL
ncbi:hypothetical protein [Streptomyces coeruleorubidus]|jgi:hypothetical protein